MTDTNTSQKFDAAYYDEKYFADRQGKSFCKSDGSIDYWGYKNPHAEWHGCSPIVDVWKDIFNLDSNSKVLDVGCGRGTFVGYLRNAGIDAIGFDFSQWAIDNPYPRCNKDWIIVHDATKPFPYSEHQFDLVTVLDLMEHLYVDDIDKVIDEIYRVCKKWVFLQIATCGSGGLQGDGLGYILKKGDTVPIMLESMAVAGHVTVQNKQFWVDKLLKERENEWELRDDMVADFIKKTPADVISNWVQNTIIIMERK